MLDLANVPSRFNVNASIATYTINLLHSLVGVDFFNVLDGASNGEELLNFFDDALQVERVDGSAALERGDVVVMDNCGFNHAHYVEPLLRQMLADCGVGLLFQPTYSPHFNTCEYCFNQIKQFLRCCITADKSAEYFRNCGYLR